MAHERHTGHDNALVLLNLRALLTGDRCDDVTVRTPMIPGVTDTEANIRGIASFISGLYPGVRYELLNYNPLAATKYEVLPGREYLFAAGENPRLYTRAQMDAFRDIARDAGVRHLVEG